MLERVYKTSYRLIPGLLFVTLAACAPTSSPSLSLTTSATTLTSDVVVVGQVNSPDLVPTTIAQVATLPPLTLTPGPILVGSPATAAPLGTLEPDAVVASADGILLRTGPGIAFEVVYGPIAINTPLRITALSTDTLWYEVQTSLGEHGWVTYDLLTVYSATSDLPVIDVPLPTTAPVVVEAQPTAMPSLSAADVQPPPTTVAQPLPTSTENQGAIISNRMREVFALGQEMGNNPRIFIKVGDSTTEQQAFMIGFGTGEYELGSYTYLQASLDYFSPDAFTRDSLASESAFNSASVLDSFRVPDEGKDICQPGEKPLECEIRVMKPAFAFILFGGNEVRSFDMGLDVYSNQIQQLIDVTTTRGVIPILTTFPHAPDFHENATSYNEALRSIAADQQIPLIDLEVAVLPLPNGGVSEEDGFHMSQRGIRGDVTDNWIMLNGEETQYGATLRNLLTLQMLDTMRQELGLQ